MKTYDGCQLSPKDMNGVLSAWTCTLARGNMLTVVAEKAEDALAKVREWASKNKPSYFADDSWAQATEPVAIVRNESAALVWASK